MPFTSPHAQPLLQTTRLVLLAAGCFLFITGCSQNPQKAGPQPDATARTAELTDSQRQHYRRALSAAARDDYETATDILTQLSRQQPQHADTWLNLASAHYEAGDTNQAGEALKKAETLKADQARVENLKGSLALEAGALEEAESHFKTALKQNSQLAEAHYNLALLYDTYYQDIARAVKHYRAYLKLTPEEDERTKQWVQQLQNSLNS